MAARGTVRVTPRLRAGVARFRASEGVCHPPPAVTLCGDRQTDRWQSWGGPSRKTATFWALSFWRPLLILGVLSPLVWDEASFSLCSAVSNDPLWARSVEWHQLLRRAVDFIRRIKIISQFPNFGFYNRTLVTRDLVYEITSCISRRSIRSHAL